MIKTQGPALEIVINMSTTAVTLEFPNVPQGRHGFQLHIPGFPVIDLGL
jgi:hypothetical protein